MDGDRKGGGPNRVSSRSRVSRSFGNDNISQWFSECFYDMGASVR